MPLKICAIEPAGQEYCSELALLDFLVTLDKSKFTTEVIIPKGSAFKKRLADFNIPAFEFLYIDLHRGRNVKRPFSYLRIIYHWIMNKPDLILVNQSGILRGIALCNILFGLPIVSLVSTLEDAKHLLNLPKWVFKHVYKLICNSEYTAGVMRNDEINKRYHGNITILTEKTEIIYYNYIRKNLFSNRPLWDSTNEKNKFVIGILGRICKSKGHDLLINTLIQMHKNESRWIDQLEVIFIGDYQQQEKNEMLQLIAKAPVNVEVTGYIKDIKTKLANLHVLIIPSIAEPFGRIVQEAAEAGLPVIASDSGGLGEICRKFNYGTLFHYPDMKGLADSIEKTMVNYDSVLLASLSKREDFLAAFSDDRTVKRLEKIFIEACE